MVLRPPCRPNGVSVDSSVIGDSWNAGRSSRASFCRRVARPPGIVASTALRPDHTSHRHGQGVVESSVLQPRSGERGRVRKLAGRLLFSMGFPTRAVGL